MEVNGQTGFEYTSKDGRVFKVGVSESISKSIAELIDRVEPQPILMLATCGLCLCVSTNPEMRKHLTSACSKLLSSSAA